MRLPFTKEPDPPTLDFTFDPAAYAAKQAEYQRILDETPPLPPITDLMPLKDPGRGCPKCGSRAVTIDYFGGIHKGCPDRRMNDWMGGMSLGAFDDPKHSANMRRIYERAVEHHDRSCVNCKHRWVEAVKEATDDAR